MNETFSSNTVLFAFNTLVPTSFSWVKVPLKFIFETEPLCSFNVIHTFKFEPSDEFSVSEIKKKLNETEGSVNMESATLVQSRVSTKSFR